jgi:DNA-binding transcriptional LysR family regulator
MTAELMDLDLLRTFVLAVDMDSFAKAADRVARSQSAVSLQMQRLEELTGRPLFLKQGRGWRLTPTGELLLGYAKQMLEINDRAIQALNDTRLEGAVSLGLPPDFAESELPVILARFAAVYPNVEISIVIDRQAVLHQQLQKGKLDMIVSMGFGLPADAIPIGKLPLCWIGGSSADVPKQHPLPLLLFEAPCIIRQAGLDALEQQQRSWRVILTSPSLSGLWAATQAGLGITLRTPVGLPSGCRIIPANAGLPALPVLHLFLLQQKQSPSPAVARLTEILVGTIKEQVNNIRKK